MLLGLQLSLRDVAALGAGIIVIVIVIVIAGVVLGILTTLL